jgi:hypothetical protein
MKFEKFCYSVLASVTFTKQEVKAMIKLSGYHYDATCIAAGLCIGEQHPKYGTAHKNGLLAIMAMTMDDERKETTQTFQFKDLDLMLKILEQRALLMDTNVKERLLYVGLSTKINAICSALEAEHVRLTK